MRKNSPVPFFSCVLMLAGITASAPAQATFTHVATHPEAANHFYSTPQVPGTYGLSYLGRGIKVLRQYKNRLYIGYGQDNGPNKPGSCTPFYVNPSTGAPWCGIYFRYFDPATGKLSPSLGVFRSQELSTLEVMNGYLYGLAEDREGTSDYFRCTASTCTGGKINDGTAHLYSATSMDGIIYMAGSSGHDGVVWKSADNGKTWQESLRDSPANKDDFSRTYGIGGPYEGKVYATPRDYYAGYQSPTMSHDGNSANRWTGISRPLETFAPARRARAFANKLIVPTGIELKEYDGSQLVHNYSFHILDFTIAGEWLYVLHGYYGDYEVLRTRDLENWYHVDTAPRTATSMEVVLDRVYVGTSEAQIYRSDSDLTQDPTKPPLSAIYFLLLLGND